MPAAAVAPTPMTPAPTIVTVTPAPVSPAPAPMVAAMPAVVMSMTVAVAIAVPTAHLFGLKTVHLVFTDDRVARLFVRRWQRPVRQRMRHQRRGVGAGGQHGCAGGNSKGEFQKVAALHDISLFVTVE